MELLQGATRARKLTKLDLRYNAVRKEDLDEDTLDMYAEALRQIASENSKLKVLLDSSTLRLLNDLLSGEGDVDEFMGVVDTS